MPEPDYLKEFRTPLVRTIKHAKHQPIQIPGINFPDNAMGI